MASLEFSVYKIMSCANRSFYSLLSDVMPASSFSCLTAPARTSSALLGTSVESGHSYPIPDLRGEASRFSPGSVMFTHFLRLLLWYNGDAEKL